MPTVPELLKQKMKLQTLATAKEGKREMAGDIKLKDIVAIAKEKGGAKPSIVTQILGTCLSGGVTVEGKDPREVIKEIKEGGHAELFK